MKARIPIPEVMAQVQARLPALVDHMFLDGEWIWYCGPSLAGEDNKPVREALKEIGFRFCFKGHPMRDAEGQPTDVTGSWGHSCERPMPRRRHSHRSNTPATEPARQLSDAELIGAL